MNRRGKLVLSLACVLAVGATVASGALAGAPASVSGAWASGAPIPTGFQPAGVNIKLPAIVLSVWTGDLVGPTVATATFLIHPDGSIVAAPSRETLTGTVAGVGSGTLDFVEEAHAQPDGSTEIDATIVSGTGDLTGLRGRVIFVGTCALSGECSGTYTGSLHN